MLISGHAILANRVKAVYNSTDATFVGDFFFSAYSVKVNACFNRRDIRTTLPRNLPRDVFFFFFFFFFLSGVRTE